MKKIFYLTIALLFSVTLVSATEIEERKDEQKYNEIVKIEKIETISIDGEILFTRYRGVCRDGHTFHFTAYTREVAQQVVDTYCALRREGDVGGEGGEEVGEN